MKKIFITISRGAIARNLLKNDFFLVLRDKVKIVILATAADDMRFRNEFKHPNVSFVRFAEKEHTLGDRFLFFFHKNLIYNGTVEEKNRWGVIGDSRSYQPNYVSFLVKKIIFVPLSRVRFLRGFARLLDFLFLQKSEVAEFQELIRREKPDLVISTNIAADTESALLKATRKEHIRSIGIAKSWDNLSKHSFRAQADTIVVWSKFMASEAVHFQNYAIKDIRIIGIPQFDRYVLKDKLLSRQEFCKMMGLDANRRIILFGSEGSLFQSDAEIASIISENILRNDIIPPSQLLIRPHYGYKADDLKFKDLQNKPNVVIDRFNNPSPEFRDRWDYSEEFSDRFMNCLYHSDVVVSSFSTLTLDAVAFNKPIINVSFDGKESKPYRESIARWGASTYFGAILKTNAICDVKNSQDLIRAINEYLKDPSNREVEREKLLKDFCLVIDGRSGKRFARVVLEETGLL